MRFESSVNLNGSKTTVELSMKGDTQLYGRCIICGRCYVVDEYKIKIVKFEGTKTTISADGTKFTVVPINIANGNAVILSLYNGDTLVEMQSKPYTGEDIQFSTDKAYTSAKVMVWNNLESMVPISDVEIVK